MRIGLGIISSLRLADRTHISHCFAQLMDHHPTTAAKTSFVQFLKPRRCWTVKRIHGGPITAFIGEASRNGVSVGRVMIDARLVDLRGIIDFVEDLPKCLPNKNMPRARQIRRR